MCRNFPAGMNTDSRRPRHLEPMTHPARWLGAGPSGPGTTVRLGASHGSVLARGGPGARFPVSGGQSGGHSVSLVSPVVVNYTESTRGTSVGLTGFEPATP